MRWFLFFLPVPVKMTDFVSLLSDQRWLKRCEVLFTVSGCHTVVYDQQPRALRSRLSETVRSSTADFSTQCPLVDLGEREREKKKRLEEPSLMFVKSLSAADVPRLLHKDAHSHTSYYYCCHLEATGGCSGLWNILLGFKTFCFASKNGTFSSKCHNGASCLYRVEDRQPSEAFREVTSPS